jgi:Fe2+ transport system protein FeoA
MTLDEARYDREVQIKSISTKLKDEDRGRIQSMGFYPGGWLKICAVGLLGGPIMVHCFHLGIIGENDTHHREKFYDAMVMVARGIANLIEVEEY